MNTSLSDKEILNLFNGKANVISYEEVHNHRSLKSLLDPYNFCIILYVWKDKPCCSGHWVAICVHKNKVLFFDSLGNDDEELLEHVDERVSVRQHEDYPYLQQLIDESRYDMEYNHKQLQQNTSAVCGRYSCYFVRNMHNYKDFKDFLDRKSTRLNSSH